jgi:hypothetical protein
MNIKMLKATFVGLILSVSGLANAGLIHMQAEYNSSTAAAFSWDMWLDEADLNRNSSFNTLSSSTYDFIDSLNMKYTNTAGIDYHLNLSELKAFGVRMIYSHNAATPFLADGTNQRSKIFDINFVDINQIGSAFISKGATQGPYGWRSNSLRVNGTSENFDLISFKSVTDVPEPSTLAIFALGMIGLASRRFKKQS